MLLIRGPQIAALAQLRRCTFDERVTAHLRHHFPAACAAIPDFLFPRWLEETLGDGRSFGLRSQRHLVKFCSLTLVFGRHFSELPHLAWMRAMLLDAAVPEPGDRMDRLYAAAIARLRAEDQERNLRERFQRSG